MESSKKYPPNQEQTHLKRHSNRRWVLLVQRRLGRGLACVKFLSFCSICSKFLKSAGLGPTEHPRLEDLARVPARKFYKGTNQRQRTIRSIMGRNLVLKKPKMARETHGKPKSDLSPNHNSA